METRSDLETELLARLMAANNSTLVPASRATKLIQDAYIWAGSLFFWPSLYRARLASTLANQQYYDYPTDFLTGSISRLYVDGVKYNKIAYQDFMDYVDNVNVGSIPPDPTKHYFAEFGRQYFLWPTPTQNGTNNLIIWGNIQPPALVNPTDTTIFSMWDDSGNEAIIKKALSVSMERIDSGFAAGQKAESVQLLSLMWAKVAAEMQKNQRLAHPMFNVFDMFGQQSGQSTIGNFNNVDTIF